MSYTRHKVEELPHYPTAMLLGASMRHRIPNVCDVVKYKGYWFVAHKSLKVSDNLYVLTEFQTGRYVYESRKLKDVIELGLAKVETDFYTFEDCVRKYSGNNSISLIDLITYCSW
jgi:hypothetical protein